MGNTRQSRSLMSSNTSLAEVAWPVTMSRSLQGCTKQESYFWRTSSRVASLYLRVLPESMTVPPQPITPFFLTIGEFWGMTMQAGMLSCLAVQARAWAWLPEEWVQTDLTSLGSCSSLLKAPLALNAPIFCRLQHLRVKEAHWALSAMVLEEMRGVLWMQGLMRSWASSIACLVIIVIFLIPRK